MQLDYRTVIQAIDRWRSSDVFDMNLIHYDTLYRIEFRKNLREFIL